MEIFDADLHFHGKYAAGVSDKMEINTIAEQAPFKGLKLLGTADILHEKWYKHCKDNIYEVENGVFKHKKEDIYFIVQTEVQTNDRVHHILFFPDFESALRLKEKLKPYSTDLDLDGRPRLKINSERLAQFVEDAAALISPAHCFTPYFSLLSHYDSLKECYGNMIETVKSLELGLSADTYQADKILELRKITFLSNSDSHSPWPHRLGREFNRFSIAKPSFEEIKKALLRKEDREIILNAGFDPAEGQYSCSACPKCYQKYSWEQVSQFKWRCQKCNAKIKRGAKDRINMLSDGKSESPSFRPKYIHIIPLADIIAKTKNVKGLTTSTVQKWWKAFIDKFGSEIHILIDEPIENLAEVDKQIANSIRLFRADKTIMLSGGGGNYGQLIIPKDEEDYEVLKQKYKSEIEGYYENKNKDLRDFF